MDNTIETQNRVSLIPPPHTRTRINGLRKKLAPLTEYVDQELEGVVMEIPFPSEFQDAASKIIVAGGKRLRPIISVTVSDALGGSRAEAVLPGIAIELIHTGSMIIDDIVDNHDLRKGIVPIHKQYGEDIAIVLATTLISKGMNMCTHDHQIQPILSNTILDTSVGEAMDLRSRVSHKDSYLKIIERKSASLFKGAALTGAISAGCTQKQANAMSAFGSALGMAFQIRDDLLDFVGDADIMRKPVGSDLLEGKTTIVTLELSDFLGTPVEKILENPSRKKLQNLQKIAFDTGIVDNIQALCEEYGSRACSYLEVLPENEARILLHELTDYAMYRDH